jgi:hypothetical protein
VLHIYGFIVKICIYSDISVNLYLYRPQYDMLVKVNDIDITNKKIKVTQLDIDDYGSVIPIKELELKIPSHDYGSIIQTLKSSSYAAIFTEGNIDDNDSTITLASGMTIDELNKEKSKTVDKVVDKE